MLKNNPYRQIQKLAHQIGRVIPGLIAWLAFAVALYLLYTT